MIGLRKLLPDGLAGRFSLLLAVALLVANLVALAILSLDRANLDSAALVEIERERVKSFLPAVEAAPFAERRQIAEDASTRFSRVSVDASPVIDQVPTAPRSAALTRSLSEDLEGRDIRAAIMVRSNGSGSKGRETVAVSIALSAEPDQSQWLNVVSRGERRRPPGIQEEPFFLVLGLSLAFVLGVGLLFVRRLTNPLSDLAQAARAAGHGNRSVLINEKGPRELLETARAFNDMQKRIARFDAERMRTLAAVGHDLRTPITSLRIRAEMLDEDDATPMIRTLDEMAVMAESLVAFARQSGEGEELQDVNLAALLEQLCAERGASFDQKTDRAILQGRPVALGRVFGNIIDNALQYGGSARVALSLHGDEAKVTIEDDGPGIAQDKIAEVFEPFVRGDDSRNLETGGVGLGLSIARNIMVAHGGAITIENREQGGLRVSLTFPLGVRIAVATQTGSEKL